MEPLAQRRKPSTSSTNSGTASLPEAGTGTGERLRRHSFDHHAPAAARTSFRFKPDGKACDMDLGSFPAASLSEAREKANGGREHRQYGSRAQDAAPIGATR